MKDEIITKRLKIVPLDYMGVIRYIQKRNWHIKTDEDERKIYEFTVKAMLDEPDEKKLWYYTFWNGYYEGEHILDIGLLRPPNKHKTVEIWYVVSDEYRNKGFCSEAVIGFVSMLNKISEIDFVGASTDEDNFASKKVLLKCGFQYACDNNGVNIFFANLKK